MIRRAALLVVLFGGCKGAAAGVGGASDAASARNVEVAPVVARTLHTEVTLPGELSAYESVALFPKVTGFVEEIPVDRGTRVKREQLLVRLSAPELDAQRLESESKLRAAEATLGRLRGAAQTPGAVAGNDLEVAADDVKAARARLRALRSQESYLTVRAPFEGVITERNVHPGALVGPPAGAGGVPMLRVASIRHLRLTVAVPEREAAAIAEGARTSFTVRAWPGRSFSGIIKRVAHSVNEATRTMAVEADVDNQSWDLAPGMYAEVRWPVRRPGPSLFVPSSALVQTTETTFVQRMVGDRVERVPVQRGTSLAKEVEVFGPLRPGELVLRRGAEDIPDGARVTVERVPPDGGATQ